MTPSQSEFDALLDAAAADHPGWTVHVLAVEAQRPFKEFFRDPDMRRIAGWDNMSRAEARSHARAFYRWLRSRG